MTDKEINTLIKDTSTNTLLENVLDTLNVETDSKSETALAKPVTQEVRDASGRFLPGVSGNPHGSPGKAISLRYHLKNHLAENPGDVDALIKSLVVLGKSKGINQLGAIKEAFDQVDGKPIETRRIDADVSVFVEFVPARVLVKDVI